MPEKVRNLKLNIHPSMGILNLEKIQNLDTTSEFKIICLSILKEEINHNLLSVLCCNPKYLFLPIIPVALILCPFAYFFSILLGTVFLCLAPLALLLTLCGLWFRKWMVNKCLQRARRKILKLTSAVIECEFSFKFFSDDDSDGGNLISFGNFVEITCRTKGESHRLTENKKGLELLEVSTNPED